MPRLTRNSQASAILSVMSDPSSSLSVSRPSTALPSSSTASSVSLTSASGSASGVASPAVQSSLAQPATLGLQVFPPPTLTTVTSPLTSSLASNVGQANLGANFSAVGSPFAFWHQAPTAPQVSAHVPLPAGSSAPSGLIWMQGPSHFPSAPGSTSMVSPSLPAMPWSSTTAAAVSPVPQAPSQPWFLGPAPTASSSFYGAAPFPGSSLASSPASGPFAGTNFATLSGFGGGGVGLAPGSGAYPPLGAAIVIGPGFHPIPYKVVAAITSGQFMDLPTLIRNPTEEPALPTVLPSALPSVRTRPSFRS